MVLARNLPRDIDGPFFGLQIGFAQILSQNAHAEQLNASQQQNDADGSRETRHGIAPDKGFKEKEQNQDKRNQTEQHPHHRGDGQRKGGKADDIVEP